MSLTFPDTQWDTIEKSLVPDEIVKQKALKDILNAYMPVLKGFLIKERRLKNDKADDILHDFVIDKILTTKLLSASSPSRGKFRNLLLRSLSNYTNTKTKTKYTFCDLSFASNTSCETEKKFNHQWVYLLVTETMEQMKNACILRNRMDLWDIINLRVIQPVLQGDTPLTYEEIVKKYKLATPRVAINLLATSKRCFIQHLKKVIVCYTSSKNVEEELTSLRYLIEN